MAKGYTEAPEVQSIAERLIEIFKPELEGFEIRYIFCSENPKKDGREVTALARKITGLPAYLAGSPEGFFCIEFGMPAYESIDEHTLVAVVHHELCHFGISDDGNLTLIPHPIEEFPEVVRVHGSYHDGLVIFDDALRKGNSDTTSRDEIISRILKR
ncbi:MAG TPA: putative metallopeptidase [Pyrinomonadaceae bacterium]